MWHLPITLPSYKANVTVYRVLGDCAAPAFPKNISKTKTNPILPTAPSFLVFTHMVFIFTFHVYIIITYQTRLDISPFPPPPPPSPPPIYVIISCQSVTRMSSCHVIMSIHRVMTICHTSMNDTLQSKYDRHWII